MSLWLVSFLGLLQGATELFPVSSLGHAVVVPLLLHLDFNPADPTFVPLLVLLHLGTATALLIIYRDDWRRMIVGFVRATVRGEIRDADERMAVLLIVGTIPAGVLGVIFEERLKTLFANGRTASAFLIVNGAILLGAEALRRRDERRRGERELARESQEESYREVTQLSFPAAVLIGTCQAAALFPGISRAGITMAGGLAAGLRHEEAARFSFLLATPVILAAGLLEVPQLFGHNAPLGTYLLGAVLAGIAAYFSARFLIRYFRVGRLDPYAYYCAALGAVGLAVIR
ncbi:MAG TPA: undecaprenyl-diphosphate phosphatase [Candidatus Angelobacter sp.]|nr:undecaprenyl-diphosphate phosphatase [Candidatus Angelobacter sp.]